MPKKEHDSLVDHWLLNMFRKTDHLIDDVMAFQQYIADLDANEHAQKIADADRVWNLLNEVWTVLDKYSTTPHVKE